MNIILFKSNLINSYKTFMIPFTIILILIASQFIPFLNIFQSSFAKNHHSDFYNLIGFAAIYLGLHFIFASLVFISSFFRRGGLMIPRLSYYDSVQNLNVNLIKKFYVIWEILIIFLIQMLGVTLAMENDFSIFVKLLITTFCLLTLSLLYISDKYFTTQIKNQLSPNEYQEIRSVRWEKTNA